MARASRSKAKAAPANLRGPSEPTANAVDSEDETQELVGRGTKVAKDDEEEHSLEEAHGYKGLCAIRKGSTIFVKVSDCALFALSC